MNTVNKTLGVILRISKYIVKRAITIEHVLVISHSSMILLGQVLMNLLIIGHLINMETLVVSWGGTLWEIKGKGAFS